MTSLHSKPRMYIRGSVHIRVTSERKTPSCRGGTCVAHFAPAIPRGRHKCRPYKRKSLFLRRGFSNPFVIQLLFLSSLHARPYVVPQAGVSTSASIGLVSRFPLVAVASSGPGPRPLSI